VRELEALVDGVVGAALRLGGANRVLGVDGEGTRLAVRHALHRRHVVGRDQVVAAQHLRVEAEVDQVRQRLGGGGVRHVVEAHHGEIVVGLVVGIAGGRAVVGDLGTVGVAVGLVERADRGADPDRHQRVGGVLDRLGHALGVVVEEAHVVDVLEGPRPPGGRRVIRRGMVVRGGDREIRAVDPGITLLQQLRGAPVQQVLRDVEVVLDDGDAVSVGAFDHERACAEARLDPVRGALAVRVGGGVHAVRADEAPVGGVLPGRGPDVPGGIDCGGSSPDRSPGCGRRGDRSDQGDCGYGSKNGERTG
jgi:hypothetical protein